MKQSYKITTEFCRETKKSFTDTRTEWLNCDKLSKDSSYDSLESDRRDLILY